MRHNWIEGSFNLIKAKSVLVCQCEHNLQKAIMWQRNRVGMNRSKKEEG